MTSYIKRCFLSLMAFWPLKIFLLLVLFILVLFAGIAIRLAIGPITLEQSGPVLNYFLERPVNVSSANLRNLALQYDADRGGLVLSAGHADLRMSSGSRYEIEEIDVIISTRALVNRFIVIPETLKAERVKLHIVGGDAFPVRDEQPGGANGFEFAALPDLGEVIESARDFQTGRDSPYIQSIAFPDIHLVAVNEATGEKFESSGSSVFYKSLPDLREADIQIVVQEKDGMSRLSFKLRQPYQASGHASMSFRNIRPALLGSIYPFASPLDRVNVPINGQIDFSSDEEGVLSLADVEITSDAGRLKLGQSSLQVRKFAFKAGLNLKTGTGQVPRLEFDIGPHRGTFSGQIDFDRTDRNQVELVSGHLDAEEIALSFDNKGGEMFAPEDLRLDFEINLPDARLDITQLKFSYGGGDINSGAEILYDREGVPFVLSSRISEMPVQGVKKLWPSNMLKRTRGWFFRNVHGGVLKSGSVVMDTTLARLRASIRGEGLTKKDLNVDVDIRKSSLRYFAGLDRIRDIDARLLIEGNRLEVKVSKAVLPAAPGGDPRGGDISVTGGAFVIPTLQILQSDAILNANIRAKAPVILNYIDQDPLRLMENFAFGADTILGEVEGRVRLQFPRLETLPLDRITANIEADIRDFELTEPVAGYRLDADLLQLEATNDRITVTGGARINTVPARIRWSEDLNKLSNNNPLTTVVNVSSELNEADLLALEFDALARRLRGPVQTDMILSGKMNDFTKMELTADFSGAKASFSPLNHIKPEGETAIVRLSSDFREGRMTGTVINFMSDAFSTQIDLQYEGAVTGLEIAPFTLPEKYDFSFSFEDGDQGRTAMIKGKMLDISALTKPVDFGLPEGAAPSGNETVSIVSWVKKLGKELSLDLELDRLVMNNGISLQNVSGRFERRNGVFEKIVLNGFFAEDNRLNFVLFRDEARKRRLTLEAPKAESLFRGLGYLDGVQGGYMSLNGTVEEPVSDSEDSVMLGEGYAYLVDFRMRDLPVLANILSLGSLQGIADVLSGEGVRFDGAGMNYRLSDGEISFDGLRAIGPSMGLTLDGGINFGTAQGRFAGNIYPAYTLNSIVGNLPVVGEVLTGGRGEGIVGISYDLDGPFSDLNVSVNPLSILVPEVLKEIVSVGSRR